jgi:CheY-like chemotaxis protein
MNNVLASISNVATLLVDDATHDQRADLDQIIEQAERGAQLTRGLLAFSRRGQYRKQVLGFGSHVRQVLPLLRRLLPKSVDVRDEIAVGDARVEADSVHLGQALVNLALNAADAMNGTGTIAINASVVERHGRQHIGLHVTDSGHGMDEATRLRVFEPFFTTKPIGQGSGLGLSIVWGIVEAHSGTVEVRSEPGVGSTFSIYVPTTDAPLSVRNTALPVQPQIRRNTVLVVDDDVLVRESTGRLLMRMGLDVLTASDGSEALTLFDDHSEQIRIVILDMGMPRMSGAECFRQLRERSDVPVLVATGYAADDNMRELFAAGARIIEKPYAATALRCEITQLLEASQPVRPPVAASA